MKRLLSLLLVFACTPLAAAEGELPRLELGAGLISLSTPDYRGSRNDSTYLLPVPYIKYRGERLRVDEGAQGILVEQPDLLIAFSGNLSLPVDEDTPEREGMDELDAIIEFGPSVNYRFKRYEDSAWWIDLPLRFAFTINGDLDHIGQVFQPRLSWRRPARRLGQWKLRFNIGPLYASSDHHAYFYSVDAEDVTADRPAYDADGGFSGWRSEFTWSKRFGNQYWFGGFVRYDSLRDTEIEDSPLVSENDAWTAGVAVTWVFLER